MMWHAFVVLLLCDRLLFADAWQRTASAWGVGAQPKSCSGSALQLWQANPNSSAPQQLQTRSSTPRCLQAGGNGVVFATNCSTTHSGIAAQEWRLVAPNVSWQAPPGARLLQQSSGSDKCIGVRGCCDGGSLALVDCEADCNPGVGSATPPHDCLFRFNATTEALVTVASDLCLDAGSDDPLRGCTAPWTRALPFCDGALTPAARAADLVTRLTLDEVASGVLAMLMVPTSYFDGRPVNHNLRQTAGVARLGVPPIMYNEAMHGISALCLTTGACPTMFPSQITQTAAFNRTLWRRVATALGEEGRALRNAGLDAANFWAPDVNPFRDPRYGRGQETGGEDAFVNGEVATEYVLGLQGGPADGPWLRATAACKHVMLYDSQTPWPTGSDRNVTKRDLNDYYLRPWRACATVARSASMMCSYGSFNGQPDCAHGDYLNGLFRNTWKWTGFVVSDCDAINGIVSGHKYTATPAEAAAAAMNAGVDLDCGPFYQDFLVPAVRAGLVEEEVVRTAARRVLEAQVRLGFFDGASSTSPFANLSLALVGSAAHDAIAEDSSAQSHVLLKNDGGLLPMARNHMRFAFIGPHANSTLDLLGNDYMRDNKRVLKSSPVAAAKRMRIDVDHVAGCTDLDCEDTSGFAEAVAAARDANYAVVFLGISSHYEDEGRDRKSLALPGHQVELALAVARAQPNTAVVLYHGGMVEIDDLVGNATHPGVPAIITGFYPGQTGGEATVSFITGSGVPSGRLPYTWYQRGFAEARGPMSDQDLRAGDGITYRYYTGKPLFPFGFGMGYGEVSYEFSQAPKSVAASSLAKRDLNISVRLTNRGNDPCGAVVLLFGVPQVNERAAGCYRRTLLGFTRAEMAGNSTTEVKVSVNAREFSCVDEQGVAKIVPGTVTLEAYNGTHAVTWQLEVTGQPVTLPE